MLGDRSGEGWNDCASGGQIPIFRAMVGSIVFERVEHFSDHFAGLERFWALSQLLHNGICLSRIFASHRFQFVSDSLKLAGDARAHLPFCNAASGQFLASHPFAPTARVNVYCMVPSVGLGPSIAAVANSGYVFTYVSRTC